MYNYFMIIDVNDKIPEDKLASQGIFDHIPFIKDRPYSVKHGCILITLSVIILLGAVISILLRL